MRGADGARGRRWNLRRLTARFASQRQQDRHHLESRRLHLCGEAAGPRRIGQRAVSRKRFERASDATQHVPRAAVAAVT